MSKQVVLAGLLIITSLANKVHCQYACNSLCRGCSQGQCSGGCIDGYYNGYHPDTSYSAYYGDCRNHCRSRCKSCSSYNICNACTDGHYNGHFENNYSYVYNGNCLNHCRSTCRSCTSYNSCSACVDGYYGTTCNLDCQQNCLSCSHYNNCGECKPGLFGTVCSSACSLGCVDGKCLQINGACNCKTGFDGSKCDTCVSGKYGTNCDNDCPRTCKSCTSNTICNECYPGYYDFYCHEMCPIGCMNMVCKKVTGQCLNGCVSGKHGLFCDDVCPSNCVSCTSESYCYDCQVGFYKLDCKTACSNGCRNAICDQSSGECTQGCIDGKHGDLCNLECPLNCLACSSRSVCSSCKASFVGQQCAQCVTGKYGTKCDISCSANCLDNRCEQLFGQCIACKARRYGLTCTESCSNYCRGNTCNKDTGYCISCVAGRYGDTCSNLCSATCVGGICNKVTAYCNACPAGKYGSYCGNSCPDNCAYNECNMDGTCASGCMPGFYGKHCNSSCPVNCTTCTSLTECLSCLTWHKGVSCKEECSNCKYNTTCRQADGYCNDECADGKYWNGCIYDCNSNCKSCQKQSAYACNECIDGRYGRNNLPYFHCNYMCPSKCRNNKCDGDTGYCVACTEGYKGNTCACPVNCECISRSDQCSSCVSGFANMNKHCQCRKDECETDLCVSCQHKTYYADADSKSCCRCSENCKNNECISENECLFGCIEGLFGKKCDKLCSSYVSNCVKCSTQDDAFYECNKCMDGFYPDLSNNRCIQCHTTCLDLKCNSTTGECLDGCTFTFWGDKCDKKCNITDCLICNRENGACEVCAGGKYSKECDMPCSETCNKTNQHILCAIDDGACLNGCITNTIYGRTCGENCSINCLNSECEWKTGECIRGCVTNKYGPKCDIDCAFNCLTNNLYSTRCFDTNGTCVSGCQSGYYGGTCEERCSTYCKNTTCNRSSGECHYGCIGDFTDAKCVQALKATGTNNGAIIGGVVGGVVVAVVLAIVIVLAVLFLRRRKDQPQYDYANNGNQNKQETNDRRGPIHRNSLESANIYSIPTVDMTDAALTNIANPNYEFPPEQIRMSSLSTVSNEELEEEEPDFLPPKVIPVVDRTYANVVRRIQVHKLGEYVSKKKTADFEEEYQDFKLGLQEDISYAESQKPNNMAKNRYRFIYPYDDHRVKLTGTGTDYINASYIDGFNQQNEYIACLGPTEKTTDKYVNFWRMVWQQKVEKIVMVTNLFENGGHKCDKYWPDTGTSVSYGDVTVTSHSEDVYADYTVRSFTVSQKSQNRSLHHIHFTAWPDKGVPDDVTSLIEFRQKVKSTQTTLNGPTIVHCSAGVGRTGTYIALDILTNEGEAQKTVDIFGCVEHMREHRVNMVQTAEQYEYLHHAVVHSLTFECQAIPGDTFQQFISSLSDSDLQKTFERLQTTAEKETQGEKEAVQKHKTLTKLNRAGANVPGDRHRPKLYLHRKPGSSDYINAVYLNSFWSKDRYIVAQTPLPETVLDFICLVYQTNCTCIVSMEPVEALKGKKIGKYFPADNQTLKLEPFQITSAIEETTPQYQLCKLTIAYTGPGGSNERTIHHFHFTQWKEKQLVPVDPTAMLQLVKDVDTKANKSEDEGPIIIHCLNGGEKSGLFCAVSVLIQKMAIEHEVSVVNTIRMVKSRRASAIPNKEQYSFCYQCVSAYLQSFDIYSNFSLRI